MSTSPADISLHKALSAPSFDHFWKQTIGSRLLKNGLASVKNMLVLKLTRFFPYRVCRWAEKRGNFKASMFFTEASPILYFFSFKNEPKTNHFALNIDFLLINFASIVAKSKVKSIDCVNPLKKNVIFFNVSKN